MMDIKDQVCTLKQAKKLAELLGDHAPESYFAWSYAGAEDGWIVESFQEAESAIRAKPGEDYYRAYTGDELGALFKNAAKWNEYPCYSTAQEKAVLAIEGLNEGWIKPEDFKYKRK